VFSTIAYSFPTGILIVHFAFVALLALLLSMAFRFASFRASPLATIVHIFLAYTDVQCRALLANCANQFVDPNTAEQPGCTQIKREIQHVNLVKSHPYRKGLIGLYK
jgi:hypothetical protein